MSTVLSPPLVVPPVPRCARAVRVQGQFEGATVTLFASGRFVAAGSADGPDFFLPIPPDELQPGDHLTAVQRLQGVDSEPSPDPVEVMKAPTQPADLGQLFTRAPVVECADCLWIEGVFPGATVTATVGSRPPVMVDALRPAVHVDVTDGVGAREIVNVSQSACGLTGPLVKLPAALAQALDTWPAPPPVLEEPLFPCERTLFLSGMRLGATIVIRRRGEEDRVCFGADRGSFAFPDGFQAGEVIEIRQDYPARRCGLEGRTGRWRVSSAPPPAPSFPYPVCAGDRVVVVAGLRRGATVSILADGAPICRASAPAGTARIALPAAGLGDAKRIGARQALCIGGPWSQTGTRSITPRRPTRRPRVLEPLLECGHAVGVMGLHAGTQIRIISAQDGEIGCGIANGDERFDVPLWFPLAEWDRITLRTLRCGALRDWPEETTVQPLPRDFMGPPRLADPTYDFGGSVLVENVVPGAVVTVEQLASANTAPQTAGALVGVAFATTGVVSVGVPRLPDGTILRARQAICSQQSRPSDAVRLGDDDRPPKYVRTFRICQMTGASDPADRPHPFDTEQVDLYGTDLGIPIEQGGRLWFFFGDTIGAQHVEVSSDPIAWTTDDDLGPDGHNVPSLSWLLDKNGRVQRLVVEDLKELSHFEVPTGGFSYDGSLYLFVATDKIADKMRTSHLARAIGGIFGQVPQKLYEGVSTTNPNPAGPHGFYPAPAGPWLVHVAPTVIRNADWPGLPVATGDGVLAFGTSVYLDSDLYLAWFPIAPGQLPPPPSEWRFLKDPVPTGPASWLPAVEFESANPPHPHRLLGPAEDPRLGELSVVWFPALRRWMITQLVNANPADRAVVCRVARAPWGPWSKPVVAFHPNDATRDAGNSTGKRFVGERWRDDHSRPCVVYAPYIVPRWSRWDASVRRLRVVYTLSTELNAEEWVPVGYQPQLMETRLEFP